ncbi:hypothetical protein HPB50_009409 [Hyalomma asiaticum]|uniref:Uncharacterized protein n=1 Tax=Hyalomma asiaticum TaxID=266040 RepID=A0ACB7SU29_HYAAI|nr:hypothetical protein HPB50_009409 [Hyalomma asiaticum]
MALTRSQARKLSQELDLVPCSKTSPAKAAELRDLGCESTAPRTDDSRVGLLERPVARAVSVVSVGGETEVAPLGETGTTLSPVAESWFAEPSTSLAAKDRQKRRAKLVDSSWRQAGEAGILPEEWDRFTERSQGPSVRRALEVNLDGPGERARPASGPRWKQLVFPAHCLAAGLGERLMQVASTTAHCLMQSAATLAVRLTQSTAIPHAPARQTLSPTGRIPASNQRRGSKRGYKRSKPRSDERERLKKSRVVIAPQCEPNKLSAPVPKM